MYLYSAKQTLGETIKWHPMVNNFSRTPMGFLFRIDVKVLYLDDSWNCSSMISSPGKCNYHISLHIPALHIPTFSMGKHPSISQPPIANEPKSMDRQFLRHQTSTRHTDFGPVPVASGSKSNEHLGAVEAYLQDQKKPYGKCNQWSCYSWFVLHGLVGRMGI